MFQIIVTLLIYLALVIPLGGYLYQVMAGRHTFADPVMDPIDKGIAKLSCLDVKKDMNWKQDRKNVV